MLFCETAVYVVGKVERISSDDESDTALQQLRETMYSWGTSDSNINKMCQSLDLLDVPHVF